MDKLIAPLLGMFISGLMSGNDGAEAPQPNPLQLTPGQVYEPPPLPEFDPRMGQSAALTPDFDWRRYVDERLFRQPGGVV